MLLQSNQVIMFLRPLNGRATWHLGLLTDYDIYTTIYCVYLQWHYTAAYFIKNDAIDYYKRYCSGHLLVACCA